MNFLIKDTSLLEGLGKMEFLKYKCIFDYWHPENLTSMDVGGSNQDVHTEDRPFLNAKINEQNQQKKTTKLSFKFDGRIPSPWDGNLKKAKIVICYANPASDENDKDHKDIMLKQLSGNAPLPTEIDAWKKWYEDKKFDRLGEFEGSNEISVFNLCPYASENMSDVNWRVASGLPSVWMAQKHLREVLIPKAIDGEIFLVIARAHRFWGVPYEGLDYSDKENPFKEKTNLRIQTNRSGIVSEEIAKAFKAWEKERPGETE